MLNMGWNVLVSLTTPALTKSQYYVQNANFYNQYMTLYITELLLLSSEMDIYIQLRPYSTSVVHQMFYTVVISG